jgi:hypothetical protein
MESPGDPAIAIGIDIAIAIEVGTAWYTGTSPHEGEPRGERSRGKRQGVREKVSRKDAKKS